MASFTLLSDSTIARDLLLFESGLIGADATLAVTGSVAVTMNANFTGLGVLGSIISNQDGILASGFSTIVVGANASVISSRNIGVVLNANADGLHELNNAGTISGSSSGISWQSANLTAAIGVEAVNSGTISGGSRSGASFRTTIDSYFVNSGTVIGGEFGVEWLVTVTGAVTDLVNSGSIVGLDYSYHGHRDRDRINNSGEMTGDISTSDDADEVINTGRITGEVDLGLDNDLYDGRIGTVSQAVLGAAGDDTILGGSEDNLLIGGSGLDQLEGFRGDDVLDGEQDNDTLKGGRGEDTLFGRSGDDRLEGGADNDTLLGSTGDDRLKGDQGDDYIDGSFNDDTAIYSGIYTSVFIDLENGLASGGGGNDQLIDIENAFGSASHDTIYGTKAHGNRLEGSFGNDTIYGLDGRDTLLGDAGNDRLLGGSDVDRLLGGVGDDYLDGGQGTDFLTGGPGADNFVFRSIGDTGVGAFNRDEIRDFDASEGDYVNLFLIDANTLAGGNQAFSVVGSFTGAAGQLVLFDTVISGVNVTIASMDVNGNGAADGQIYIVGGADAGDFLL